ncbi:MAG: zinc-binding dehydrogenase, partial [Burkholderiales bacterium]|nr:zinc-binding dehydrogenase [Burkholderiales bacterium]
AALGEPLSVAVHAAIERTTAHSGDVALISGPGCVGLLTMQVAKLEGARVIVAGIEKDGKRLACARELGADMVVNAERENLLEAVMAATNGRGADLVYECSGSAASLSACWEAVKKEGTLVPLGIYPGPIQTDFNKVTMKELRVIGSYGYVWTSWRRTVALLAEGKVKTAELISHEYPLERFEEAFRATQSGEAIKVALAPEL